MNVPSKTRSFPVNWVPRHYGTDDMIICYLYICNHLYMFTFVCILCVHILIRCICYIYTFRYLFYFFFRVPPFYFKPLRPFRNPNGFRCRRQEYDIYRPSMQTCYLENMPVPGQQCWFEHVFSCSRPCWTYEFIFMNCCEQSWENAWHGLFFGLKNRCFQLVKGQFTNRIRVIKFLFQFCWDSV